MPSRGPRDLGGTTIRFRIRPVISRGTCCWVVEERGLLAGRWRVAAEEAYGLDSFQPINFKTPGAAERWVDDEVKRRIEERAHLERAPRYITRTY